MNAEQNLIGVGMIDLIDRWNAIDVLEIIADKMSDEGQTVMAQAVAVLKDLQSEEPERKNGEWIKEDLSGYLTPGGNSIFHCSECGHTEGPWPRPRLTNFCPSCGADMRGEK